MTETLTLKRENLSDMAWESLLKDIQRAKGTSIVDVVFRTGLPEHPNKELRRQADWIKYLELNG